jgi:chromosome segregation ATPase
MSWFFASPTSARFDRLIKELGEVKTSLTELKAERRAIRRVQDLETEYEDLKRQLTDKQIEYDREKEKWEREKRDTEHMVGLQKRRGEFEADSAKRDATLTVREENLKAQQDRFAEQVKFIEKRFDQQFEALNGLMEKVIERMPTTKQLITVGGGNNEGAKE